MAIVQERDDMVGIRKEAMEVMRSSWILIYKVAIKFGNTDNFLMYAHVI